MPESIPADIRAELDQTPEWWDREYKALCRRVNPPKPFEPSEHEGHDLVEVRSFAGDYLLAPYCIDCGRED